MRAHQNNLGRVQRTLINKWHNWSIFLILLLGTGLRLARLDWQPLWADEGYSVYFATEPLRRMLWLTANDIHPPLYYALLHGWLALLANTHPVILRLFSSLTSIPAVAFIGLLAHLLFPNRKRLVLLAMTLLAINPFHLFYSQEIRMYGLTMTITLASTIVFWQAFEVRPPTCVRWWLLYIGLATAALYALYYAAFLLVAHSLWAVWRMRGHWRKLRPLFLADLAVALLYLPWVFYAAANLAAYVDDKVVAEQDEPLTLLPYLLRHLLTFFAGPLSLPTWPPYWRWISVVALLLLIGAAAWHMLRAGHPSPGKDPLADQNRVAHDALWFLVLVPSVIAFLLNRSLPFFPEGGERLLLFLLPYVILLVALGIDRLWQWWHLGKVVTLLLLFAAGGGLLTFYTLPRHRADDYRLLVRQVVQQGKNEDTLLATFPWQVGLWRTYAPLVGLPLAANDGPHVSLLGEHAVTWGEPLRTTIDEALAQGTLWFPGLRSIGSTLPAAIDQYMAEQPAARQPVLLVDAWYGNTTLRAWHTLAPPTLSALPADWETVQLRAAGVAPLTVASANTPLRVDLQWAGQSAVANGMTLRLVANGKQWANHDLDKLVGQTGLIVPAGLPPGRYTLYGGVIDGEGNLLALVPTAEQTELVPLATITVLPPDEPLPPARLPLQRPLDKPVAIDGLRLLGFSAPEETLLAGESLAVTLFWQNGDTSPPLRNLYVSLIDGTGNGVAGWEGWPFAEYPTTALAPGALLQTPVEFALPPTLATGTYHLGAGLLDPAGGTKSAMVLLGNVAVRQRPINYVVEEPPIPITPVQFGTHARLIGYAVTQNGPTATIRLYWQILQPLLPPHHLFIHLDDATGQTLAQSDDVPQTVNGPAPSGSWLPGEFLVTETQITDAALAAATASTLQLTIGLYVPATEVRLPTTANGAITGDHVTVPLQP